MLAEIIVERFKKREREIGEERGKETARGQGKVVGRAGGKAVKRVAMTNEPGGLGIRKQVALRAGTLLTTRRQGKIQKLLEWRSLS